MKILCSMVATITLVLTAGQALADAEGAGDASRGGRSHLSISARSDDPIDVRQVKLARGWGYGLLAGGLVMNMAGVVMVEADAFGTVGLVGFIGIGVGLLHWAVSFIALGTTRPLHLPKEQSHWSPAQPGVVTF